VFKNKKYEQMLMLFDLDATKADSSVSVRDVLQDRRYTCNLNIEARSCNHCCSGKAISITHSECVFVSSMQCSCAILPSVACPAIH